MICSEQWLTHCFFSSLWCHICHAVSHLPTSSLILASSRDSSLSFTMALSLWNANTYSSEHLWTVKMDPKHLLLVDTSGHWATVLHFKDYLYGKPEKHVEERGLEIFWSQNASRYMCIRGLYSKKRSLLHMLVSFAVSFTKNVVPPYR